MESTNERRFASFNMVSYGDSIAATNEEIEGAGPVLRSELETLPSVRNSEVIGAGGVLYRISGFAI